MAILKCKMCGGELNVVRGEKVAECEFCGTKQTIPDGNDEKKTNLFNRANRLRIVGEFDKAAGIYESITAEFPDDAESYWGLCLCKFGIEYVDDPKTARKIPTCHRTSFESIFDDENYKSAIEKSDVIAQDIYKNEATEIDRLQKDILSVVHNEKPFDVFICYKETDDLGERTQDSVLAQDIYTELTNQGLKVFFARITLEDKLGKEYEPYIFAALNSAKVMLAIGTKEEYFNSVWVKNEWSRYLALMQADKTKTLIPCYRDMDAYDIPQEFKNLQGQDMAKLGFLQDLVRGVCKIANPEQDSKHENEPSAQTSANATVDSLLKRAFMFLEDGDWDSANEYCEKVLDIDPENAEAYLGKLMAMCRANNHNQLVNAENPFDNNPIYQKIMRFGDEKLKEDLIKYVDRIKIRNENNRKQKIYNNAHSMIKQGTVETYNDAINMLKQISGYKDSAKLIEQCKKDIEEIQAKIKEQNETDRKNKEYEKAISLMKGTNLNTYASAMLIFTSLSGWKDSAKKSKECNQIIHELAANEKDLAREKKKQSEIESLRRKKRKHITTIASIASICIVIFLYFLYNVIIPNSNYSKAISLMNEGKYDESISIFSKITEYKDTREKIKECKYYKANALESNKKYTDAYLLFRELTDYKDCQSKAEAINPNYLKESSVGDYVIFGTYTKKDGNVEDIEWLVLEQSENKKLIISKEPVANKAFDESGNGFATWSKSTIRQWLNNDFYNTAFQKYKRNIISETAVSASKSPNCNWEYDYNETTQDKIFLLSIDEAQKYFKSDADRICKQGTHAITWFLRTPGKNKYGISCVENDGSIGSGNATAPAIAIRPAMWIDLSEIE